MLHSCRLLCTLAVLLLVSCTAYAKFSIELAGLKVVFPPDARRSMTMAMADFG